MSSTLFALIIALAVGPPSQTPPHPATPQMIEGHRSGFVQGTLNLAIGERATLKRRPDGAYDLIAVDRIGIDDVLPPAEGSTGPINTTEPGTVRLGLMGQREVGSILKVENGQDAGLRYTAHIVRRVGGRSHGPDQTPVCTVPPGLVGFERWPEPVLQVVVGNLTPSGDALPTCGPYPDRPAPDTGS